jgi:hypothetical protein
MTTEEEGMFELEFVWREFVRSIDFERGGFTIFLMYASFL